MGVVLVVLEVVLVVLEVVLVVLEVTGPQVSLVKFQIRLSLRPDLYSTAPPITIYVLWPWISEFVFLHQCLS